MNVYNLNRSPRRVDLPDKRRLQSFQSHWVCRANSLNSVICPCGGLRPQCQTLDFACCDGRPSGASYQRAPFDWRPIRFSRPKRVRAIRRCSNCFRQLKNSIKLLTKIEQIKSKLSETFLIAKSYSHPRPTCGAPGLRYAPETESPF